MADSTTDQRNLYLYGIVPAGASAPAGIEGIQGGAVQTLSHGPVAVAYSEMDEVDALGTPDDLRAHTRVLDGLGAEQPVLPLVFGTVAAAGTDLGAEILKPREEGYAAALDSIRGCTQYSLVVRFDRDIVLREVVEESPEAAELRSLISGTTEDQTRTQRMRLGEIVVAALEAKQPAAAAPIVSRVAEVSRDHSVREARQPEDVVDLAALVQSDRVEEFERAIEDLAEQLHPRLTFRLVGPQAPYDFVPEV